MNNGQICRDLCVCGAMQCNREINPASWKQSCSSHFVNKYVNITNWQTVIFPPTDCSSSVFLLHRIQLCMFLDPRLLSFVRTSCTTYGLFLHTQTHAWVRCANRFKCTKYTHARGMYSTYSMYMTHTYSRTVVYTHIPCPAAPLSAVLKGHKSVCVTCRVSTALCVVEKGRQTQSHTLRWLTPDIYPQQHTVSACSLIFGVCHCPCVVCVCVPPLCSLSNRQLSLREYNIWH